MKKATERKESPEAVGPIIEQLISRLGLKELVRANRVFAAWGSIVGDDIARHTRPQSLRKGTLIVHVDSSVWLAQLDRYLKGRIRGKINRSLEGPLVERIVFRIGEIKVEDD